MFYDGYRLENGEGERMAEVRFAKMKYTDAEKLRSVIDAYFARVDKRAPVEVPYGRNTIMRRIPATIPGLAAALHVTVTTLSKYMRGEIDFPKGVSEEEAEKMLVILTDARNRIETDIIERGLVGDLDTTVVRQHMAMFGYSKSMDEAGEDANNKVTVIIQGASAEDAKNWAK